LVMCHQISVLGIQTAADLRSTIEVEMARLAIRLHVAVRIPRRLCLVRRPENADFTTAPKCDEAASQGWLQAGGKTHFISSARFQFR